jgi:hypothetical protein
MKEGVGVRARGVGVEDHRAVHQEGLMIAMMMMRMMVVAVTVEGDTDGMMVMVVEIIPITNLMGMYLEGALVAEL